MRVPGILLAAPASGSGKTAAACALMSAFKGRGLTVRACKCGPDYIDPMFHRVVLGVDSRNLDLFFSGGEELRAGYADHVSGADLAVTEGVMGYYDGMSMDSDAASSYDVSRTLGLPVILVLPCGGASLSLSAVAKGMVEYRPDSRIRGILLNRVSGMLYPRLKSMLERELRKMGHEIPVVGYMPEDEAFSFESRHLGLVTPQELDSVKEQTRRAGELLAQTVDLDLILGIAEEEAATGAEEEKEPYGEKWEALKESGGEGKTRTEGGKSSGTEIRIGVARDRAFCFYYKENMELLEKMGCSLIPFSPLSDPELPGELDGLILGGGYPELYARQLSENRGMRESVWEAVRLGMPCLAECGGFMYLHEEMEDGEGNAYPMAGVIPGRTFPAGKLVRFGYINVSAADEGDPASDGKDARLNGPQVQTKEPQAQGQWYLRPGESIRGHEFHYWDSTHSGHGCEAVKPDGRRRWKCIHAEGNLFAGYPHLYLPSLPVFAERFVKRCAERRRGGSGGKEDEAERSIG